MSNFNCKCFGTAVCGRCGGCRKGKNGMTTIAWDKEQMVAADSLTLIGDSIQPIDFMKLKHSSNIIYGAAGCLPLFDPMIRWYQNGANPKDLPAAPTDDNNIRLLIFTGGRCFTYTLHTPFLDEQFAPAAWGSGSHFALGALDAGASAEEAVSIACKRDTGTGGKVQVINLRERA